MNKINPEKLLQLGAAIDMYLFNEHEKQFGYVLLAVPVGQIGQQKYDNNVFVTNCDRDSLIAWLRDTANELEHKKDIGNLQRNDH